jgi:uncharacterized membrane protein YfcA
LKPEVFKEFRNISWGIISIIIILYVRDFMIITAFGPFFMAIGARWSQAQTSSFSKGLINLSFVVFVLYAMTSFLGSEKGQEFTQEAQVIQQDLNTNATYGSNRYDLGITDFSSGGMLRAMPISIYTAFYRPYLWEGDSFFVRISALESFIFIILTFQFIFKGSFFDKFNLIRNNEFLMAALIFSLVLGFFAGFTSGLFGVLVRFKAPLLPFLFLVLMYKKQEEIPNLETKP